MASFFKQCVCLISFLSFSVFGDQEGICVDCVKGDQTEQDIQNMNKLTCQKMMQNPECVNVPGLFKADCDNYDPDVEFGKGGVITCLAISGGGVIGGAAAIGKVMSVMESMTASGRLATLVRRSTIGAAVAGGLGALYFGYQYHKAKRDTIGKARSEGWTRKQHTDYAYTILKTRLADKLYNLAYNDAHCYNPLARGVRICGALTAIVGTSVVGGGAIAGGLAAGSGPIAVGAAMTGGLIFSAGLPFFTIVKDDLEQPVRELKPLLDKEFRKVQQEVKQKMREADPLVSDPDTI